MSTREMAYEIVDQFTEEQLQAFLILYGKGSATFRRERDPKKVKALEELDAMIHPVSPDLDYDAELTAYREEKYGK